MSADAHINAGEAIGLTPEQSDQFFVRMRDDFEYYAPRALKVKPKEGALIPFRLNFCQSYVHAIAQYQLKTTGRVRIILCKGRQQGMSTYIEGRLFWKTTHNFGLKSYILTHEDTATRNLFEMAKRYLEHCPPDFKPVIGASNAQELVFKELDTQYALGTAGSKGTGRSQTIHLFHGSEVAYWPHAEDHASGVMQAVPEADGTEIFLESTANGVGDLFHKTWQSATDVGAEPDANSNGYIRIFIPWFWQDEYQAEVIPGFIPDDDENELMETYGLTLEQLQWRRKKLKSLGGDLNRFQRDYPCTPDEAFNNAVYNTLIKTHLVVRARKQRNVEPVGPRILGVDVAREGDDRTVLLMRQGRVLQWVRTYTGKDNMEVAGLVLRAVREFGIDHIFCDGVGNASGVIDRLRELGFGDVLTAIKGNYVPLDAVRFKDKRSECWGRMNDWLQDEPVQIPDSNEIQQDLCGLTVKYDSNDRMLLERKSEAKKRGIKSPDIGDALAFTFAQPVMPGQRSYEGEDMSSMENMAA